MLMMLRTSDGLKLVVGNHVVDLDLHCVGVMLLYRTPVDVLTLDHAGDDVSEIVVHVVFVATVVGLLVHLDALNDNFESISFDQICC